MNSYIITVKCADREIQLLVRAHSKNEAEKKAEPSIQAEITSRIISRKIRLQFPAIVSPLNGDRNISQTADARNHAYFKNLTINGVCAIIES